ncbi:hypothetical protein [Bogoriella caseilytica]|uniref:Uncharacterized protein n=1 Tax=Bogoriella caseilytica TaxID=56055 RepID=A0A3N2BB25_9MICO|nr:hypothetical protein [Bogoriella caseilytica]ROR72382.1 hypothetical protein EDD31_0733 [Bogoriella caseilytica]
MLGYRSIFTVDVDGDPVPAVLAQVQTWLQGKQYAPQALTANGDVAQVGDRAEAVITTETDADGSSSALFTLREDSDPRGAWITQIIAHTPAGAGQRPWVWIDVEQEGVDDVWAARPRVARELLAKLPGDDHGAPLTPCPTLLGADEVDGLIDVLTSRERRGPVFVAGSSETLPINRWADYVEGLLRETVGLSAGYVLDGKATERFAEAVGARHAVRPGTLRTYLPGLDPSSNLDALRHRFLTTETILESPPGRIRKLLGLRARDLALKTSVPRWAGRVESRLLAATDARVLDWRPTALVGQDKKVTLSSEHVVSTTETLPEAKRAKANEAQRTPDPTQETTRPHSARATPTTPDGLAQLARELFATDLSEELLRSLATERGHWVIREAEFAQLSASHQRAVGRAQALNDRLLRLEDELAESRRESEDAQLEWADAQQTASELERTVLTLRRRLMEAGQQESAWADPDDPSGLEITPESFAELLVRFDEFTHVRFTGDETPCEVLDQKMPVGAAAKAWSALVALEHYARGKKSGEVVGGVQQYLTHPPEGYATFSANRHAANESEDVRKNPKFSSPRILPVPTGVDSNGRVFMGSHFKIARLAMVSPRLHYHDATAVDGCVYVGYIGPHLPTQATN